MSFTDLARGCSTLYALADLIQDSTYQLEPNKKWMGFQSARKSVKPLTLEELHILWQDGDQSDDGVIQELHGIDDG